MQIRRHFVEARHALDFVSKCVSRRPSNWRACKCRLIEWREREKKNFHPVVIYTKTFLSNGDRFDSLHLLIFRLCGLCLVPPSSKHNGRRLNEVEIGRASRPLADGRIHQAAAIEEDLSPDYLKRSLVISIKSQQEDDDDSSCSTRSTFTTTT